MFKAVSLLLVWNPWQHISSQDTSKKIQEGIKVSPEGSPKGKPGTEGPLKGLENREGSRMVTGDGVPGRFAPRPTVGC